MGPMLGFQSFWTAPDAAQGQSVKYPAKFSFSVQARARIE
jgi:hypothetical protein